MDQLIDTDLTYNHVGDDLTEEFSPMRYLTRVALAAFALSLAFLAPAGAADQQTVKVSLIDMTAMFGPGGGSGAGYGPGMMGQGYGPAKAKVMAKVTA